MKQEKTIKITIEEYNNPSMVNYREKQYLDDYENYYLGSSYDKVCWWHTFEFDTMKEVVDFVNDALPQDSNIAYNEDWLSQFKTEDGDYSIPMLFWHKEQLLFAEADKYVVVETATP